VKSRTALIAGTIAALLLAPTTIARPTEPLAAREGAAAPAEGPTLADPNLELEAAAAGLVTPIGVAFLGDDDMLVIEKNTGKVQRLQGGEVVATVLDLSVNAFNERGLLGIALDPDFATDPAVYLFWTCRSTTPLDEDRFTPEETSCSDDAMTGIPDSELVDEVPLLGNRVDRFSWDGSALHYDRNLEVLRAFQADGSPEPAGQGDDADGPNGEQPSRGNHNGGILAFGPDEKLYVMYGDQGRCGLLQNLPCGPTATSCGGPEDVTPDDQFGGPEPDDAHISGVILRLNEDGSTPSDNPFFGAGADIGGEVGANVQRIFAYGVRNSFGMAFDPVAGGLWQQENGEDAMDEINRVTAGENSGWIQIAGPSSRVVDYRGIETTALHHEAFPNLQQFRWGPELIATTPAAARNRLHMLPGAHYSEPEFSWKYVLAPAGIGFQDGRALGSQYAGDLFVGFSTLDTLGGPLFRFNLTGNRRALGFDDPRLADRVADNATFHDMTESESLVFGTDFGVVTDIETGPNGNLFVVSLDQGTVWEIGRS
jgi:aldose sugar dehydrogenase